MRPAQAAEDDPGLVDQTKKRSGKTTWTFPAAYGSVPEKPGPCDWVTDTFAELHQEYPHLTIELFTNNADGVQERLEHGLLDFGLFIEPFNPEKYNFLRLPEPDRVGVVTSLCSPWAHLEKVTPEDLQAMPLLISSRTTQKTYDFAGWSGGRVTQETMNLVAVST